MWVDFGWFVHKIWKYLSEFKGNLSFVLWWKIVKSRAKIGKHPFLFEFSMVIYASWELVLLFKEGEPQTGSSKYVSSKTSWGFK